MSLLVLELSLLVVLAALAGFALSRSIYRSRMAARVGLLEDEIRRIERRRRADEQVIQVRQRGTDQLHRRARAQGMALRRT